VPAADDGRRDFIRIMDSPPYRMGFTTPRPIPPMIYVLALLMIALAWAPAQADDNPWFQVEVVIFDHADPADVEAWPDDPGSPDMAHAVELSPRSFSPRMDQAARDLFGGEQDQAFVDFLGGDAPPAPEAPVAFRLLPGAEEQLAGVIARLNGSGEYHVLYHAAWRQPANAPDESVPVHIHDDPVGMQTQMLSAIDEYIAQGALEASPSGEPVAPSPPPPPPAPVPGEPAAPSWRLNGVIGLAQSRYLHLDVDLIYQVKTPADQVRDEQTFGEAMVTRTYRMQQSRRIRSDKIFYFDHPRFGVLAKVTPYKPPPPPEPPSEPTTPPAQDKTSPP
jgi:hypothetical protein